MAIVARSGSASARARRRRAIASVAGIGLFVGVAAFDWTWCRPLIQHYIQERSGRRFDFDSLHGLDRQFAPTLRFRGLLVQNAP